MFISTPRARIIFLFLLMLIFIGCKKDDAPTNLDQLPTALPAWKPFENTSVFFDPIPANPAVDANSADMVQGLVDEAGVGFVLATKEWTVPVYYAGASDPRYDFEMTAGWAPKNSLKDVPVPDYASPDPEGDGHMVIIDTTGGCIYDFWQAAKQGGEWKASWGNALPLTSDGIFPRGMSARGSGFELLQGMVWPDELAAGQINHALVFSYNKTRSGGPVTPATESDGTSNGVENIPEGALVQLNPALDLDGIGLTGYAKTIAKALQEYGMYCGDDGGGLTLYAVHPNSVQGNPYDGILPDVAWPDLSAIPTDQFRVLELPAQDPNPTLEVVANGCNVY